MKTRIRNILIILVLLLAFCAMLVYGLLSDKVTMNPPGTVGNTAGNLNNSGLFCEYNGTVYFSNASDKGCMYSMNADETNVKKLNSVTVCNLLAGGDYLYYFQMGASGETGLGNIRVPKSFNRCRLDGKQAVSLTRDTIVSAQLVDNYLYMMAAIPGDPTFSKMKIDKSDSVILAHYQVNPACAQNGIIYYNGTETNHYLYALDTSTDVSTEVWAGNLWNPVIYGDHIYYMDVAENYRLCRYSLTQGEVEILTNDRIDCFNVGSGYIYYQINDEVPQLKCMTIDGTGVQVLAEGNYTNINMTSQYVYFQEFGIEDITYHSPLGASYYEPFSSSNG